MARTRFSISNFDQFKRSYESVAGDTRRQKALRQAFPEFYKQLTNEYKTAINNQIKKSTPKAPNKYTMPTSKVTSTVSKAKDIAKGVASKAKGYVGGAGRIASRYVAPIQGLTNIFSSNSDMADRGWGLGMVGTGIAAMANVPYAAPIAGSLLVGDMLKKNVAPSVGRAIGERIYGTGDEYTIDDSGFANAYEDKSGLLNLNLTPEQQAKVADYNKAIMNRNINEANRVLEEGTNEVNTPFGSNTEQVNQMNNDVYGGTYTVPTPPTRGLDFSPQNSQNGQEGGLNLIQDNLYQTPNQPSLNSIVEPVNYSNEYLASQNNLINQLYQNANQGVRNNMAEFNPYELRPYAQIDNTQMAPVPTQQQGIDYGALLNNFNKAMEADKKQNQMNAFVNAMGVFGTPSKKAPVYYVGANGRLNAIELDQPNQVAALPTDTQANYDKLMGQLKIQNAQQDAMLAQQKQAAANLKAQQEYIANQNMMNALGRQFNVDPAMFANPDIAKAALQYVFNPNIQAQANIQETIGKAPTEATLKAAEQRGATAGKLDEIELGKQYDIMIANINNEANMRQAQLEQMGMDRRTAATLANQAAVNQFTQLMENIRNNAQMSNALQLQTMRGQNAKDVANIYVTRGGYDEQAQMAKDWNTAMQMGMPIPQAIKYMQVRYPNFSLSQAEQREMNR